MEWLRIGMELLGKLVPVVVDALQRGDDSVLDQKVSELLGHELRTTIVRRAAEQRAQERFRRSEDDTRETPVGAR